MKKKNLPQTVVNDLDIDYSLKTSCLTILSKIQKKLVKGSGWIIDSIDGKNFNISI